MNPISPRLILNTVLALALAGLLWAAYARGSGNKQREWDADKLAHAQAIQDLKDQTAETTKQLQGKADAEKAKLIAARAAADARTDALIAELQNRPERGGGGDLSTPAGACTGQTGASLARGDAEFLARFAGDANRLQIALDQCQAAYQSAREALK